MDFLGPVGLTLAAAFLLQKLPGVPGWFAAGRARNGRQSAEPSIWMLDYRFVVLGAFLPDVVDKATAFVIAPGLVNHSLRSFGHSLVGVGLFTAVSVAFTRSLIHRAVLSFALALAAHLVLDRMWNSLDVLFWPVRGWEFSARGSVPFSHWVNVHFSSLPSAPLDLIGLALLFVIVGRILATRSAATFLKTGTIS